VNYIPKKRVPMICGCPIAKLPKHHRQSKNPTSSTIIYHSYPLIYIYNIYILWRFPKMGVPLNHPFLDRLSMKKTIRCSLGVSVWKSPDVSQRCHLHPCEPCQFLGCHGLFLSHLVQRATRFLGGSMKRKPWPLGFTLPFIRDYEGLCGMIF
jgi:hypothetical protein